MGDLPTISTGTLTATGTWSFELEVTDSSGTPQTVTSNVVTVLVNPAFNNPTNSPTISVAPTTIDSGQSATLTTTASFSGGTPSYSCQWLVEAPGAESYSDLGGSFGCSLGDLPTISTGTLAAAGTWHFELEVTDSSGTPQTVTSNAVAVAVSAAFTAPVISVAPTTIDSGQSATLSTTVSFSGGTPTYTCQWLVQAPGAGSYSDLSGSFSCTASSLPTISTGTLTATGTWSFKLEVTDTPGMPQTVTSNVVNVLVSTAFTAPVISVAPTTVDSGQSATLTTTASFGGGTPTYTCRWLVEAPGAESYSDLSVSFSCTTSSLPTISTGTLTATGTWHFELQVTDSSDTPQTVISNVVSVLVNTAFSNANAPVISVAPTTIDSGQSATLTTTSSFTSGGTSPYSCQWLEEAPGAESYSALGSSFSCTTSSLPTISTGTLATVGTWHFELQVTDSAGPPAETATSNVVSVLVNPAFNNPGNSPTISVAPAAINSGQSATLSTTAPFSGGTSPYSCQWLEEAPGAESYSDLGGSFSCTTSSLPTISTGTLTATGTWSFELQVTDSSGTPQTVTSNVVTVLVNSAYSASPVIAVYPTTIDSGQSTTLATTSSFSGGIPSYTCQWLEEGPGAESYSNLGSSFSCTTSSLPTMSTGALTTTGIWDFELKVTDSAETPQTVTSNTVSVLVNSAYTASPVISVAPTTIDSGQGATLSTTTPFSGGTPTYTCQWLEEGPGAESYSDLGVSFSCTTSSLPTISTGTLTTVGTWHFKLVVTDNAGPPAETATSNVVSVLVNAAYSAAPVISVAPTTIDSGQSATLSTTAPFNGGTSPYSCQWLEEAPGAESYSALGSSFSCTTSSLPTISTGTLATVGTWHFELQVTDSAGPPAETATSNVVSVLVNSAFSKANAPVISVSPTTIDSGQSATLTTTSSFTSGGTSPYSCQWLEEAPGAESYSALGSSFSCTTSSLPTISTGTLATVGTWHFELQVTDSAGPPAETATSNVVSVLVNSAFSNANAPVISVSPTTIDSGQSATLTTTSSFTSGGTSPYSCQWLEEAPGAESYSALGSSFSCTTSSLPTISTGTLATVGTWHFELKVTDSSGTPQTATSNVVSVLVNSAFSNANAPVISVSPTTIDSGQSATLTTTSSFTSGGTSPYSCRWLEEAPGAESYSALGSSFSCTTSSLPTISTGMLATVGTWHFELQVTDSAGPPAETATSNVVSVLVNSAFSNANAPVISVSPTTIDSGQSATLTTTSSFTSGGTSPYSCQWLEEAPGAESYSALGSSFSCTTSSLPTISTGTLATVGTWHFELQVTDSAGPPAETATSNVVSVLVNSAFSNANAPVISVSPTTIDSGQSATLTTTSSFTSGGTSPYSCQWLEEAPGAESYSALGSSFSCTTSSLPTISTGTLATVGTWHFELQVTDSAGPPAETATSNVVSVLVNSAFSNANAPVISVSPTTIDSGQSATLTTTSSFTSGGTSPYSCRWLEEAPGAESYSALGSSFSCTTSSLPTISTGMLATVGTWHFELQVTDSAGPPAETATSNVVSVLVNSAFSNANAPVISVSPTTIDSGQSATLTTTSSFTSGGTSPYSCQWLEEAPGAESYSALGSSFSCTTSSLPTISTGMLATVGTWHFELQVTDSAGPPAETATSNVVSVLVNPAFNNPGNSPTISAAPATINSGQSATLSTTVSFSGGTPTYTCQWLVEAPGAGIYSDLSVSFSCTTSSLPTISTGTLTVAGTWSFELEVTDSSGTPQTVTSNVVTVLVNSAYSAAPVISVAPTTVDSGQSATLTTTSSFSGGTSPYSCQWLEEAPGAESYSSLGSSFSCTTSSLPTISTGTLATVGTWHFELQVTDSAGPPAETATSNVVSVLVNSAFSNANAPVISVSPTTIDSGQSATLSTTSSFTSGGTSPYSCQWLEEAPGAESYSALGSSFSCTTSSLPTISTGTLTTTGIWNFELVVTDSAGPPAETATSNVVSALVNSAFNNANAPVISVSPTTIDSGQSATLTTTSSFTSGGTSPYSCQWLEEAPGAESYSALGSSFSCSPGDLPMISAGTLSSLPTISTGTLATVGTWHFELQVTDSAGPPAETATSNVVSVLVNSAFNNANAPVISVSPTTIDSGQSATLTTTSSFTSGGTSPYSCQWLEEAPGAESYSALGSSFSCTTSSLPTISTGTLATVGTWHFELQVTDSAGPPAETATSNVVSVLVNPAFNNPGNSPTISAAPATINSGQSATLSTTVSFSGGTPTYTCQWLVEAPGAGIYSDLSVSFSCTTSSLPTISTGTLAATGTWSFELEVTDSSGTPQTVTSNVVTVLVNSAYSAAPVISVAPTTVDSGQSATLTTTSSFSGGTSPYSCQWLEEAPGAESYSSLGSSFSCTTSSLPTISTGTLATVGTWHFELKVTDSSATPQTVISNVVSVLVNSAFSNANAPVISVAPTTIDSGQSATLTTTSSFTSGGTSPYSCQWLEEAPGAESYSALGSSFSCTTSSLPTISTGTLATVGTWHFELQVTDSAGPPAETATSNVVSVLVNSAFSNANAPVISVSPTTIDSGQSATLSTTSSFTSGGTSPYSCQWLEEAPGAESYSALGSSFSCTTSSLPTISTGTLTTTGIWNFELVVTDSAGPPAETATSNVAQVTVQSVAPTYTVTFTETGLPSGTEWTVTFAGAPESSTTDSIVFNVPNGVYSYSITPVPGYSTNYNGQATVRNGPAAVNVIFVETAYRVTFTETGLPSGTSWSVTLNGTAGGSTSSTIQFTEPNGTYSYTVGTVPGYTAAPPSGALTVDGANVDQGITFTVVVTTYSVTFTETGLPSGTSWSVTLNGTAGGSTSSTIQFTEPNGTYSYTVGTVPGYTAAPPSGALTVDGANVDQGITFTSSATYSVTFTETGLPSGTSWSVTLNGSTGGSTGSSIQFTEPNGTYSYTVGTVPGYTAAPPSGALTVDGANVDQGITFTSSATYSVTFTETGLPSGTSWSVTLNGSTGGSTGSSIQFTEPNGTYSYTVGTVPGYTAAPPSGALTADGANVDQGITFTTVFMKYTVTFTETGLPSGTSWSVTLDGTPESSASSTITFMEPNGTYGYTISNIAGWRADAYSGTVAVNGAGVDVEVTWSLVTYTVLFTETGLAGETWGVTFNGTLETAVAPSSIMFSSPNGTFTYEIMDVPGWHQTTLPYTGTGTVAGLALTEPTLVFTQFKAFTITFQESGPPVGGGGNWTVTINGTAETEPIGTAIVSSTLPNGSYAYTVSPFGGWYPSPGTGSGVVEVAGDSPTINVVFSLSFDVTFIENGLPTGTNWSVTLNSTSGASAGRALPQAASPTGFSETISSNTTMIRTQLPNGTYTYVVHGPPGYSISPPSGTVTIDANVITTLIAFANGGVTVVPLAIFGLLVLATAVCLLLAIIFGAALATRSRSSPCSCSFCTAAYRENQASSTPRNGREPGAGTRFQEPGPSHGDGSNPGGAAAEASTSAGQSTTRLH